MVREGAVRAWYVPPAFGVPRDCWMYARLREPRAPFSRARASLQAAVESGAPTARPAGAERLETPRLVLRRLASDDADAIFTTYAQDPEVSRYLTWAPHRRIEETQSFLRLCEDGWARGTVFGWAIVERESGRLVGSIDIRRDEHRAEIGYVLARSAWRRGYATEAASAVVAWGLAQPAIQRVWAVCDVENPASARVLEKAGMTREARLGAWATLPAFDTPRDVWCYARVRDGA
jgi:[ribosomal protein S5]-alanine N-acetyltransferase